MTWLTPALIPTGDRFGRMAPSAWTAWPRSGGLGSAVAGAWTWDTAPSGAVAASARPRAARRAVAVQLSAPSATIQDMAEAASASGRTESDIWAEAAFEWLQRHGCERATEQPLSSRAPQDSPVRRRERVWRDIDAVLDTLRDIALSPEPSAA